jgi:hypothetical protein
MTLPLSPRHKFAVTTGNFVVIGDNDEVSQNGFELFSLPFTPVFLFRTKVQLTNGNERDRQEPTLDVRGVSFRQRPASHQVRYDVCIKDDLRDVHC